MYHKTQMMDPTLHHMLAHFHFQNISQNTSIGSKLIGYTLMLIFNIRSRFLSYQVPRIFQDITLTNFRLIDKA